MRQGSGLILPKGAYPWAPRRLLEACRDYATLGRTPEELHEGNSRLRFVQGVLANSADTDQFSVLLQRRAWRVPYPRLEAVVYDTGRDNLVLEVQPWPETMTAYLRMTGTPVQFEDFSGTFFDERRLDTGCVRLMQYRLDKFEPEVLRGNLPWEYADWQYRNTPVARQLAAKRRELVFLMVMTRLHRLSLAFHLRLQQGLVCFGPERYVAYRSFQDLMPADAELEPRTRPAGYFDHALDPRAQSVLNQAGVDLEEVGHFLQGYLLPEVASAEQRTVLAEFLGPGQPLAVHEDLLGWLCDYFDTKRHQTRFRVKALADPTVFTAQLREVPRYDQEQTVSKALGLKGTELYRWLLRYAPSSLTVLKCSPEMLRDLLAQSAEYPLREAESDWLQGELRARALDALMPGTARTADKRLHRLAQRMGFGGMESWLEWAAKHAPEFRRELVTLRSLLLAQTWEHNSQKLELALKEALVREAPAVSTDATDTSWPCSKKRRSRAKTAP